MDQCTQTFTHDDKGHEVSYTTCRKFPRRTQDGCEEENAYFCTAWTSAGYFVEVAIGFAALCLISNAFGISTGSRRRRIWKAVAGLIFLFSIFQLVAFVLITDIVNNSRYPSWEYAKYGKGASSFQFRPLFTILQVWVTSFSVVSWVIGLLTGVGVVITGVAAKRGKKWAAGNRAYRMIPDHPDSH
ncbi:hypothetical protein DL96DRAFT_1601112 [Flagelloscypha sp. PMI_526]|nr:hypothetical protein DL96DRAFT_1601112 [Flagelloscypha sp. PMI_526]